MKFYKLDTACATKETGAFFPQITRMKADYDYDAENSVHNFRKNSSNEDNFEVNPNFDSLIMNGKSKVSDLLSESVVSGNGFLVSNRFKELLLSFNLPKNKFYPVKIIKNKNIIIENYFWFEISLQNRQLTLIDFKKTSFRVTKNYSRRDIVEEISIDSIEDFNVKRTKLKSDFGQSFAIMAYNMVLLKKPEFDIFNIGLINHDFYISEDLKQAIIDSKITGCDIHNHNQTGNRIVYDLKYEIL